MINRIELVKDPEQKRKLYEFVMGMPFDYPDYDEWVKKCYRELQLGYKQALVCLLGDEIIGNLIFQQHKEDPLSLELKNSRVNPKHRRKRVFTRLYRNVERYAIEKGFSRIVGDTHADNNGVIKTSIRLGFHLESTERLYDGRLESILVKCIK